MNKLESLCKALRCVASQDCKGDCYMDHHNFGMEKGGGITRVVCTAKPPEGRITCPYYQDDYGVCAEDGELN